MNVQIPRFRHEKSVDLDGSTEAMRLNTATVLGIGNTWSVMVSCKVFATPIPANSNILQIRESAVSNNLLFILAGSTNQYGIQIRDSANSVIKNYTYGPTSILPNIWAHIIFTWDGTTLLSYFNGALLAPTTLTTDNAGTMTNTAKIIAVGADTALTNFFPGQISQVAIWNSVLTASEAADIYNSGNVSQVDLRGAIGTYTSYNNLQHWWPLGYPGSIGKDFGYGANKVDLITDASNVTEVDDASIEHPNFNNYGRWNEYCLDMDGVTERMRTTASNTLFTNTWSALVFIKSLRDTAAETFYEMRTGGTNPNRVRFQKRGDLANAPLEIDVYDLNGVAFKDYLFNNALPLNQWVGILATWDGTNLLTYINKVLVQPTTRTTDIAGTMTSTNRTVGYAAGPQIDQLTQCRIHNFALWTSALTADQAAIVTDPYNANWLNLAKDGYGYTSSSTLLQWWRAGIAPPTALAGNAMISSELSNMNPIQGSANISVADIFRDFPGI